MKKTTFRIIASKRATALGGLLSMVILPAGAHDPAPVVGQAPSAKPADVRVVPAAALVAVRDATTGELRAPTAEEAEALVASARVRSFARVAAPPALRTYSTPSGGFGLTLGESTFGLVVAKRVDGKPVMACVPDEQSAQRFLANGGPAHE